MFYLKTVSCRVLTTVFLPCEFLRFGRIQETAANTEICAKVSGVVRDILMDMLVGRSSGAEVRCGRYFLYALRI